MFLKGASQEGHHRDGRPPRRRARFPQQGATAAISLRRRAWASCCRKGRWPVSSRFFVFLIPLVVIAIFWADGAATKQKPAHDPTHKSFFERNGTVLGIVFILLVAFWTLFLVVLPYLYMVVGELPSRSCRRPKRGGPEGRPDPRAVQVVLRRRPPTAAWNATHMWAFVFTIVTSVVGDGAELRHLLSAGLLHGAGRHARRRCACSCWR